MTHLDVIHEALDSAVLFTSVDFGKSQLWLTSLVHRCAPVSHLFLMLFLLFPLFNNIWHICLLLRLMSLVWDLSWIKLQKKG